MKVYITTTGAFPNGGANSNRIICYAKGLKMNHIECEVLTTSHRDESVFDIGIKYLRFGLNKTSSNFFVRSLNYLKSTFQMKKYILQNAKKGDVVLLYHNEISQDLILYPLKRKFKLVRELCEIPSFDKRLSSRIFRFLHYHCFFKIFSGFIAISTPLEELAIKYKRDKAQVLKVPILVDLQKYENTSYIQSNMKIEHPLFIFHSGTMTEQKDGFLGMLEILSLVRQKGIDLHLYSTGIMPKESSIEERISNLQIEDYVHFLGFVKNEDLIAYQGHSLAFIVNKHDTLQNRYCFATKVGEYLASKRPVIMTNIGEATLYLKNEQSAFIYNDGDVDAVVNILISIIKNPTAGENVGKAGYQIAQNNFSYQEHGLRISNFFQTLKRL